MTETRKSRRISLKRRLRNAAVSLQNWWESRYATTDGVIVAREPGQYVLEFGLTATLRRHCHVGICISPAQLRNLIDQATEVLEEDNR